MRFLFFQVSQHILHMIVIKHFLTYFISFVDSCDFFLPDSQIKSDRTRNDPLGVSRGHRRLIAMILSGHAPLSIRTLLPEKIISLNISISRSLGLSCV